MPLPTPSTIPRRIGICADCGEVSELRKGGVNRSGSNWYRNRCDDCYNAWLRAQNRRTRPVRTTQALNRKAARKQRAVAYAGGCCRSCGYARCIRALNFHHRDPATKSFTVSQNWEVPWEKLTAEIDKCDLLCFNCHMELHCDDDQDARPDRASTCIH